MYLGNNVNLCVLLYVRGQVYEVPTASGGTMVWSLVKQTAQDKEQFRRQDGTGAYENGPVQVMTWMEVQYTPIKEILGNPAAWQVREDTACSLAFAGGPFVDPGFCAGSPLKGTTMMMICDT